MIPSSWSTGELVSVSGRNQPQPQLKPNLPPIQHSRTKQIVCLLGSGLRVYPLYVFHIYIYPILRRTIYIYSLYIYIYVSPSYGPYLRVHLICIVHTPHIYAIHAYVQQILSCKADTVKKNRVWPHMCKTTWFALPGFASSVSTECSF